MPDNATHSGPGRPKDPEKRRAILDAAKNLFIQHGYQGTSMDTVASLAGVSKLTVYSHFSDKERLFIEAVMASCEELLPAPCFEFRDDLSLRSMLLTIARAFEHLINSPESLQLHRLMATLGTQDRQLSQTFFDAGPQRILDDMERFMVHAAASGQLHIPSPRSAAGHFLSLIKGIDHFRLLVGCCEPLTPAQVEAHVQEVVELFMRAYGDHPVSQAQPPHSN